MVDYESTGEMWDYAINCNNDWRPFRILNPATTVYPDSADDSIPGCLSTSKSYWAIFTPGVYGTCYPGLDAFLKCPDYFVCFNGTCLTSCVTDDDCYVFEPWNDVSCPYAMCNTGTGLCERKTGGTPGTGGSCPAEADKCTFNDDSGSSTGDDKSIPLIDGVGHTEVGLVTASLVAALALALGRA